MTEISSVDPASGDWDSFKEDSESRLWEKIGRVALAGSIFAITPSFFSAVRKKRVAVSVPASPEAPLPPAPLPEANLPETAPLKPPSPPKEQKIPYADLYCAPKDREIIGRIITIIAAGGIDLLWKLKMLDELGEEILPVHPYKFLSTILLNPRLKICLQEIFKDPLPIKRRGFLGGIKRGMEREKANLENYIEEFAAEMGTTVPEIRPLMQTSLQTGDWSKFITHLLSKNPKPKY